MIEHVVLLKPKSDLQPQALTALWSGLGALRATIPGIASIRMGENSSPEGKAQGYTLGFVVTFHTAADRDAYLPHPEHLAVVPLVRAVADDVLVFDLAHSANK
jgi:Stress responsive A/B Barrel Domain